MSLFTSCSLSYTSAEQDSLADSLSLDMHEQRYRDCEKMRRAALNLQSLSALSDEERMMAVNTMAYSEFMSMNYSCAKELYASVIESAECEIESLVADVGMMYICYRTSANREFFDYRSDALQRVRRINEEVDMLPDDERERFYSARLELAAVSLCYFADLGMVEEAERTSLYLEHNISEVTDLSLKLYGRMLLNYRIDIPEKERVESLIRVLARTKASDELWLAANCRLMLAVLLRSGETATLLKPAQLALINDDNRPLDELPLYLAQQAVDDFRVYGDKYMLIEALSVAASCCTQNGRFADALALLEDAMLLINGYYRNSYPEIAVEFALESAGNDAEYALLTNDSIYNIYECLLGVRRDASCAFAGVGDKYLSDINRNSYLDLLHSTRLNKQMESRISAAESSASRLYMWIILLIVLIVAVSVLLYRLDIRWGKRNKEYIGDLMTLLSLCRHLMESLPKEIATEEDVNEVVAEILNRGSASFVEKCRFVLSSDEKECSGANVFCMHPVTIDKPQVNLYVITEQPLSPQKKNFLYIALPYIAAAIDEGRRVADIGGERQRLQEQSISYSLYIDEHKRENVNKRVALSVVGGIRPYIERMQNELCRLTAADSCGDEELARLNYLLELTSAIEDYNAVLARWIKMRKGELSLHIENFALSELMGIISKSVATFEMKGVALEVKDTPLVVKADKALTLFMINTLADNARKFTPDGGKVTIEAIDGDTFVEVAVTDTGVGMASEDVERILGSKVYDASQIGRSGRMATNKGGGFGLMNCKGIIEKYRKTDEIFSVCEMNIKSEQGSGSRFSFRLPKGIKRTVLFLLFGLFSTGVTLASTTVGALADSVYSCNVRGDYEGALNVAQELIAKMNTLYRSVAGGNDTLSLVSGTASEIMWWRNEVFPDSLIETVYYNLLDMRNEAAVAALALRDLPTYRYNNSIYTRLYRLVHEDKELVNYYEYMQSVANYRRVAVVLCVTILLLLLIVALVKYMRNVVIGRMNGDILLQANARVLEVARSVHRTDGMAQTITRELYTLLCDYLRIESVRLALKNGSESQEAVYPSDVDAHMQRYTSKFPLELPSADEKMTLGVLSVVTTRRLNEGEETLLKLIAGYLSSATYHSFVRLTREYRDLDEMGEEADRIKSEENRLHVRNMVIDNCLSVIKHETIYYPGRIRELLLLLRESALTFNEWREKVASMCELMDYYSSIFGVLTSCAARQMDDADFRVAPVKLQNIISRMGGYVKRRTVKMEHTVLFESGTTDAVAMGDAFFLEYMFESLVGSLVASGAKRIGLSICDEREYIKVEIVGTGVFLSAEQCSKFFVPVSDEAVSMEPLIAREIVRMHEDFMDIRSLRLMAKECSEGCVITVTLPKFNFNSK